LRRLERTSTGWEGVTGSVPQEARWLRVIGPDSSTGSLIGQTIEWPTGRFDVAPGVESPFNSDTDGRLTVPVVAPAPTSAWTTSSDASWLSITASSEFGSGTVTFTASPNTSDGPRQATVSVAGRWFRVMQATGSTAFVLQRGFQQYFAEGVVSDTIDLGANQVTSFFDTEFALLNPTDTSVAAFMKFQRGDGTTVDRSVSVPARTRATLNARHVSDLLRCTTVAVGLTACNGEFSTIVESEVPLVVDRTVTWDLHAYGAHAETGIESPATTWYLAEGATHSGFDLFYLLQNPQDQETTVEVEYLRPAPLPPLVKSYSVAPRSRFTIWVDNEDGSLAATDVSARLTASLPIIVERAMYLGGERMFQAGHGTAGITAPQERWFFAEGATGAYFDLFVLVANPGDVAAEVKATYLLPSGATLVKTYEVAPRSRFNIWVDHEDPQLADTAVSTVLESTNGVGIVAERAMWWPGNAAEGWHESHASAGATDTGTLWALAAGRVASVPQHDTYVLIANTSQTAADVAVSLLLEDGSSTTRTYVVAPLSRFNVAVATEFLQVAERRFGVLVESRGPTPAQLVVERAMYNDAGQVRWAAGTNAIARRLR
jgi:hypothetical protein